MVHLKNATTEQLRRELARREVKLPEPVASPDFSRVIAICKQKITELKEQGYDDDDTAHNIYEEAMVAVFGPDVFDWINEVTP